MKGRFPVVESMPVWHGDKRESVNQYVEFSQEFFCAEKEVTLFLSCDSRAAVYVNGDPAGFALYDGTKETGFYETFDLAPFLKNGRAGKQRLQVVVYYQGADSNCYTAGRPYLIFGAKLRTPGGYGRTVFFSGEDTLARRDMHYRTGEMEKNQIGYIWHYDAAVRDAEWERALVLMEGKSDYRERPIPRQELTARQPAELCAQGKPAGDMQEGGCCLIYDMGEECSGFLELEVEAEEGSLITIGWGEHLVDGGVRSHIGERHFECSYRCRTGRQIFFHPFQRIGLRYLEVHIDSAGSTPAERTGKRRQTVCHYAGVRPLVFPVEERGVFRCGDALHQKIYEICVKTLRLCMHEHYEDCPWREQALYALDSANQMLCGYYCFGEYGFAAASLELLGMEMGEDGFLPLHVPGRDAVTIPYYTFMWVIAVRDHLMYAGDEALVQRLWQSIRRAVDLRLTERKGHLLTVPADPCYWNFYEWSETLSGEPIYREEALPERVDAPYMMTFVMMLEACGEIAAVLGEAEYGDMVRQEAKEMRGGCHALFWDEKAGYYHTYAYRGKDGFQVEKSSGAELVQALAVLSKTAGEKEREMVLAGLAAGREDMISCTLAMMRYKYEALLEAGDDRYADTVFRDIAAVWGHMLEAGATSFWETALGEADFDGAGSLCHGWSAIPVYFYYAYLLGIKPGAPGFSEVRRRPLVEDGKTGFLEGEVHGVVPMPGGIIKV